MSDDMLRLCRALAQDHHDDAEISKFARYLAMSLTGHLPPERAALYERVFLNLAQAAEELGPDVKAEDLVERAAHLAARPL